MSRPINVCVIKLYGVSVKKLLFRCKWVKKVRVWISTRTHFCVRGYLYAHQFDVPRDVSLEIGLILVLCLPPFDRFLHSCFISLPFSFWNKMFTREKSKNWCQHQNRAIKQRAHYWWWWDNPRLFFEAIRIAWKFLSVFFLSLKSFVLGCLKVMLLLTAAHKLQPTWK